MSESKIYTIPDGNNKSIDPALMLALTQSGGFGNGMSWMWPMFLFFMFPWLFGGYGGFGGFGGFGGNAMMGNVAGTGFLTNLMNNDVGRDLLLQAINGRADSLGQLASILNTSVSQVQNGVNSIQNAIQTVGSQVGMTGQQVINSVQAGDAALSQQLCQCCCDMRYNLAEQTNQLQVQAAANHADATLLASQNYANQQLQSAQNHAATQLQMAQIESADQLAVCQQTNTLSRQADGNTNAILGAIQSQNAMITKEFCDLKERELQNKINTQGDIITQLRGQISNDHQTLQLNNALHALDDKIDAIASKQPNTVPVQWPNIVAANATPQLGQNYYPGYWGGNGFGGGIVF